MPGKNARRLPDRAGIRPHEKMLAKIAREGYKDPQEWKDAMGQHEHQNYRRVIDVITKTFNANRSVDIAALHDRDDIFDVTMTMPDGGAKKFRVVQRPYELEVVFGRDFFTQDKMERWLGSFEFELEQTFLVNVKVDVKSDAEKHIVKITL